MNSTEIIKSFGWLSVLITWLSVSFMVLKWRGNATMSISKHAAAFRHAYIFMAIIESIVLPMFFLFTLKWVVPELHLPALFTICMAGAGIGLVIAAWIPDVSGWRGRVHGVCAYGAALLFLPASLILFESSLVSRFAKWFSLFVLCYMVLCIVSFAFTKKARQYHLYVQAFYILLFDLSILAAGYIR